MSGPDRPLHVLLLLESHYPAKGGGGAEGQVRTIARGLRERGQRVTVLTPLSRRGPRERISRTDGVVVCRLPFPHLRVFGAPVLWFRLACFLISRRRRYDAWHAHIGHHLAAIACVIGAWLDKPVMVKVAGGWEFTHALSKPRSLLSSLTFHGLLRAHRWQAISQRIAQTLAQKGVPRERLLVIPNAVDTRRFQAISPTDSAEPRFLFMGRLAPVKGLDILLDAFSDALSAGGVGRLRILGSGPLNDPLRDQAARLGISGRVSFEGHRSDVEAVLADADFTVLSSHMEGLSNTLLECMAAGLPAIATRVSGSEDLVRPGDNGWLCEPGDRAGLADCLLQAMQTPADTRREMGRRARQAVEEHSGMPKVLDRLMAVYASPRSPAATDGVVADAGRGA
jgi:glycosyltransferase involved in cell wall biosynthesis